MYEVFNMGIGFCYVVEEAGAERTLAILKAHGRAGASDRHRRLRPAEDRAHPRARARRAA
jgi:hypothetical protein